MKIKKAYLIIAAAILTVVITRKLVLAQSKAARLQDAALNETSGIAASRINKNILYVHNDSGDTSRFFAINTAGQLKETFYYKTDNKNKFASAIDCEDIAVGPGPQKGKSYIYLGDIGDNHDSRKTVAIYRFLELVVNGNIKEQNIKSETLNLKYPDGAHDAEALMIDPVDRLFYIITKREDSVGVYTAPLNASFTDTILLQKRCKVHFAGFPLLKWITAGDISTDGSKILVKSYQKIYYWTRKNNEHVWQVLQSKPQELAYTPEKQGEAIGFTPDGKSYYTTSEGKNAPLYYHQLP